MPIALIKYSKKNSDQKPVEYIGIHVKPISSALTGVLNLRAALSDNSPEEFAKHVVIAPSKEDVIKRLFEKGIMNSDEIHFIMCTQPINELLGVQPLAPKILHDFVKNALSEYKASFDGMLQIMTTQHIQEMQQHAAMARNCFFTPVAPNSSAIQCSKINTEKQKDCSFK